jgi:hypothetical protein
MLVLFHKVDAPAHVCQLSVMLDESWKAVLGDEFCYTIFCMARAGKCCTLSAFNQV